MKKGTPRKKESSNPSWFRKGNKKVFTDEERKKISEANTGENNANWKGDSVKYRGLHKWVRNNKLVPLLCGECGKQKPLQASNISKEYKRDLNDWEYLCAKCHMVKDGTINNLIPGGPGKVYRRVE